MRVRLPIDPSGPLYCEFRAEELAVVHIERLEFQRDQGETRCQYDEDADQISRANLRAPQDTQVKIKHFTPRGSFRADLSTAPPIRRESYKFTISCEGNSVELPRFLMWNLKCRLTVLRHAAQRLACSLTAFGFNLRRGQRGAVLSGRSR